MDELAMKARFKALPETSKALLLLDIMHQLTVVMRGILHDGDNEKIVRATRLVSELNHMLTSKVRSILEGEQTYPDDVVIEGLVDKFLQPELKPHFSLVWDFAIQFARNR